MPSPKAVLFDIVNLNLDPTKAHKYVSGNGRLRAETTNNEKNEVEQKDIVVQNVNSTTQQINVEVVDSSIEKEIENIEQTNVSTVSESIEVNSHNELKDSVEQTVKLPKKHKKEKTSTETK